MPVPLSELVRCIPALATLPGDDLAALGASAVPAHLPDRYTLLIEGQQGDSVFLVMEGEIHLRKAGLRRPVVSLGPGAAAGIVETSGKRGAEATYVAWGPVRVAAIRREQYEALVRERPRIAVAFQLALGAQLAREYRLIASNARDLLSRAPPKPIAAAGGYDVAVIGGGPLGLLYAMEVKRQRPESRVAVVEQKESPGYKIGESTLSPFVAALLRNGFTHPVLRRLFSGKIGLTFWWTDESSDALQRHVSGLEVDETYQIERRPLEMAFLKLATRQGIDVFTATRLNANQSQFSDTVTWLTCERSDGTAMRIPTRLVCDATGPASVLPRAHGLYTKNIDGFQCNAYYGYFRPNGHLDIPYWDVPATRHLCFPQGWMWFITLTSWEKTPDETLSRMIDYLLDFPGGDDSSYPTRADLVERFHCQTEDLVSIGVVVRDDMDTSKHLPVAERFAHYVEKYPGITRAMSCFELVKEPYHKHGSYFAYMKMAHDSSRVTGDGWLALGDAAMFTNPLFSPGLNVGAAMASFAADESIKVLDERHISRQALADYESRSRDVFSRLLRENESFYYSFKHVDTFEQMVILKIISALTPVVAGHEGRSLDVESQRIVTEDYADVIRAVVELHRASEHTGAPQSETVLTARQVVEQYLAVLRQADAVKRARFSRFCAHYTDVLERDDAREKAPGMHLTWRCPKCRSFVAEEVSRCSVCGSIPKV